MKMFTSLLAAALFAGPALAADVGVSLSIGQPNFYGNIVIGDAPPPVVVYREPMVVTRTQVVYEPVYLHVRAGEAQNWPQYCGHYNACGRPVYFVEDDYYNNVYAPHYREHHDNGNHGNKHGHGHGRGNE